MTAATTTDTEVYDEQSRGVIPFDDLQFLQSRAILNYAVVDEYAEAMSNKNKFPAASALYDGTVYWVYDGAHRGEAARKKKLPGLLIEWRLGDRDEAEWLAIAANQRHGLQRTDADKRRSVKRALELRPSASDRLIAEHCGVSHGLVGDVRAEVQPNRTTRTSRSGNEYDPESINAKRASESGKNGRASESTRASDKKKASEPVADKVKQLPRCPSEVSSAADSLVRACESKGVPSVVKGLRAWMEESKRVEEILNEAVLSTLTSELLVERATADKKFKGRVLAAAKALSE